MTSSLIFISLCFSYTKSLLLGVAISCNFGGMMTPISSLQNALAVSNLEKVSPSHLLKFS
jgi:di/tricarboxylate transporter